MNILITGATGFIGSHLLKRLQSKDAQLFCLVQDASKGKISSGKNTEVLAYKALDEIPALLANKKFDYVFHLATYYSRQHSPAELGKIINSNISFGTYILETVSKSGGIFVNTDTYLYVEKDEVIPENLYAATKAAFNEVLKFYSEAANFKVLNLHLTDTYGPQDPRDKIVNMMIKSMRGEDVKISLKSPLKEIHLLHVDDVVDAITLVIENAKAVFGSESYKNYSLQAMEAFTIQKLVEKLKNANSKLQVDFSSANSAALPVYVKLPILPGWTPKRTDTVSEILKLI